MFCLSFSSSSFLSPLFFLFVSSLWSVAFSTTHPAQLHWPVDWEINDRPCLQTYFSLSLYTRYSYTHIAGRARLELLLLIGRRRSSVRGHLSSFFPLNSKEAKRQLERAFPCSRFPPLTSIFSFFLFLFVSFYFPFSFSFFDLAWSLNSRHYSTMFLYQSLYRQSPPISVEK